MGAGVSGWDSGPSLLTYTLPKSLCFVCLLLVGCGARKEACQKGERGVAGPNVIRLFCLKLFHLYVTFTYPVLFRTLSSGTKRRGADGGGSSDEKGEKRRWKGGDGLCSL